ncbi:MAG: ABC transporter ATP-binding protein [Methanobacteriota archaeon]|nr:MAG: ABC transporter ATP-binding protein [Euryarchaeota archaeon]
MVEKILRTVELHKRFRIGNQEVEVLRGISIEVFTEEIVALMGKSGSGKTTLLNIIGGLIEPTSGKVFIKGMDVFSMSRASRAEFRRKEIGWVFQDFNLIDNLTALENVMIPLLLSGKGTPKQAAQEALEKVGLKDRQDHFPDRLSGGERQRVAIARAIVTNPQLILADEPTGNLDSKTGNEIMNLFRDIASHAGILMVTHDKNLASKADRILFLRNGKIERIKDGIEELLV